MKQTSTILSIIALVAVTIFGILSLTGKEGKTKVTQDGETISGAPVEGAIVFYDLDRILNEYDMANDERAVVETKMKSISDEINRRGNKLQSDINAFQEKIDKGLMTRTTAEEQGQKLTQRQNSFQNYANEKQAELAEEQQVMVNKISDAIKQYIDKYNADKHYSMIIANTGGLLPQPVTAYDPSLDITDELLAGLNDEYVKQKAAQKGSAE